MEIHLFLPEVFISHLQSMMGLVLGAEHAMMSKGDEAPPLGAPKLLRESDKSIGDVRSTQKVKFSLLCGTAEGLPTCGKRLVPGGLPEEVQHGENSRKRV